MVGDERAPPFLEKLASKTKKDPLVPVGALLTVGFLVSGIYSFKRGNQQLSQKLMRGRVVAQGFTVAVMFAGLALAGRPEVQRQTPEDKMAAIQQQPNKWEAQPLATSESKPTMAELRK